MSTAPRSRPPAPRHDSDSATRAPSQGAATPRYASNELFQGGDRILIEHNGEHYSLRITRQRKLILTK